MHASCNARAFAMHLVEDLYNLAHHLVEDLQRILNPARPDDVQYVLHALHFGHNVAVTILTDSLIPVLRRITAKLVDLIVLAFALCMIWFCWRWFSPYQLALHGFDTEAFQGAVFNFIYAEPTTTLGIPKYWVWMVMWAFALGATLHSVANLLGQNAAATDQDT